MHSLLLCVREFAHRSEFMEPSCSCEAFLSSDAQTGLEFPVFVPMDRIKSRVQTRELIGLECASAVKSFAFLVLCPRWFFVAI